MEEKLKIKYIEICIFTDYIAEYSHYGFEKGWNLLSNRWRDNMDYEWESWKTFLYTKSGWFVAHCVLSAVTRIYSSKVKMHLCSLNYTNGIFCRTHLWYMQLLDVRLSFEPTASSSQLC